MKKHVWQGIAFGDEWLKVDISKLTRLEPMWQEQRDELMKDTVGYERLMGRIKREHAIETGAIEGLYQVDRGLTETLINDGFHLAYISHNSTNISPQSLLDLLTAQQDALEFVFDYIKQAQPINNHFVKSLHQVVCAAQTETDAKDQFGQKVKMKLLVGEYKQYENNPSRPDGTIFTYCPPLEVPFEMNRLIDLLAEKEAADVHPIILSAWLHHAFTQIHPFQDGNGRMARLLASLVLIKGNLLPFSIPSSDKKRYIDALEAADDHQPQALVSLFCEMQVKYIAEILKSEAQYVTKKAIQKITSVNKNEEARIDRERIAHLNRVKILSLIEKTLREWVFEFMDSDTPAINVTQYEGHINRGYSGNGNDVLFGIIGTQKRHNKNSLDESWKGGVTISLSIGPESIRQFFVFCAYLDSTQDDHIEYDLGAYGYEEAHDERGNPEEHDFEQFPAPISIPILKVDDIELTIIKAYIARCLRYFMLQVQEWYGKKRLPAPAPQFPVDLSFLDSKDNGDLPF